MRLNTTQAFYLRKLHARYETTTLLSHGADWSMVLLGRRRAGFTKKLKPTILRED